MIDKLCQAIVADATTGETTNNKCMSHHGCICCGPTIIHGIIVLTTMLLMIWLIIIMVVEPNWETKFGPNNGMQMTLNLHLSAAPWTTMTTIMTTVPSPPPLAPSLQLPLSSSSLQQQPQTSIVTLPLLQQPPPLPWVPMLLFPPTVFH